MSEPWRRRCPEGHTSIVTRPSKSTYRCRSCGKTYSGEPVDAKRDSGATPEGDTYERVHPNTAVYALYQATRGIDGTAKARQLSSRPVAYGQALRQAAERGYVRRLSPETTGANRWQLTESGLRFAQAAAGAEVEA